MDAYYKIWFDYCKMVTTGLALAARLAMICIICKSQQVLGNFLLIAVLFDVIIIS